jgi:hypothetical protein
LFAPAKNALGMQEFKVLLGALRNFGGLQRLSGQQTADELYGGQFSWTAPLIIWFFS